MDVTSESRLPVLFSHLTMSEEETEAHKDGRRLDSLLKMLLHIQGSAAVALLLWFV